MLNRPAEPLSEVVQGLWIASVANDHNTPVVKPLYSDAGSGVVLLLSGEVKLNNVLLEVGATYTPVSKQSTYISLSPGAQLAGIRFQPAIGYGLFGEHFDTTTPIASPRFLANELHELQNALCAVADSHTRMGLLNQFAHKLFGLGSNVPATLSEAIKNMPHDNTFAQFAERLPLSQRQLERQFRRWLTISPKQYQRIIRVKKAIAYLREHSEVRLSDVAQQFGFSDQAHMTREFRAVALYTPRKFMR